MFSNQENTFQKKGHSLKKKAQNNCYERKQIGGYTGTVLVLGDLFIYFVFLIPKIG